MSKKVLFTASTFSHILKFHLPYLQYFQAQGWTVHAACGGLPASVPFADEVLSLPFEKSMGSPRNVQAAARLRAKIADEDYSLISTHTSLAAFFTRLALVGLKRRPPVANMVHGYLFDDGTPPLKRTLLLTAERWMAPKTDLLLTMNRWDLEAAKKYRLGKKVVHIPGVGVDFAGLDRQGEQGGEDPRAQWGIPRSAFVLFYAAEFSARKSQPVLIRAMERLPENAVLVLAGEGATLRACQEQARSLGAGRVVFPGYVQNPGPWYKTADAAVSASRSEGLPFNVMEAMYCGLPVVASAVKGHTDLIRDGETGLLYPYGDAEACAQQIARLMDAHRLRLDLGERAHEEALRYGIDAVFPSVAESYASLLPETERVPAGVRVPAAVR